MVGELGRVPVRGGRSGKDDATHFRFLGREQDVECTGDIGLMGGDRVPRRPGHRRDGSLMQDVVHALHCPPARFEPGGVATEEADAIADGAHVLAPAGREVVEHGDFCAVAHKALDEV